MQKTWLAFATLLMVSLLSFPGRSQTLLSKEEIGNRFTHFYIHPDSGALKLLIRSLQENQEAREALPAAPVVGFFSAILLSDSPNKKIAERELKAIRNRFDLFDYALYYGKSQDTIYHWTNRKPDANDLIWGAFFGTGETRYLEKLLGETQLMEREDSIAVFMTGASAKWSLASNARQHEVIRNYLTQKEAIADDRTRKMLGEILRREPALIREEIMNKLNELKLKGRN